MKLSRVNLGLLAAVCVLAAGVAMDTLRHRPTEQIAVTWPAVLPDLADRLQISGPDGDVEMINGEGGWELVVPAVEKADRTMVEGVLRAFKDPLTPDVRIADRVNDPDLYGLGEDDRITVRFLSGDEPLLALELGRALPGGSSFVRPEGDRGVYRAQIPSRFRFEKPPSAWRNHAIIDLHAGHVVGVNLTRPDSVFHLQRRAEDWVCLEAPELILDTLATENLARSLATLRAQQVLDDPPEGAFEDAPLKVTAMGREGAIKVLEFGSPTEDGSGRYARAGGNFYVVHQAKYSTFDVDPLRLRDRTIVRLDTVEVSRVTVTQGERRFVAVPIGEYSWSLVEPKGYSIDGRKMAFTLNAVLKLRAHELIEGVAPADVGLDQPGVLTFLIEPIEAQPITIRVAGEIDELHAVQRVGTDQLYRIRRTTARSVSKGFGLTP